MELIFGAFSTIFIFCIIIAISFVISRFTIKVLRARTERVLYIQPLNHKFSIFARLFLKFNYLVYHIFILLLCFLLVGILLKLDGSVFIEKMTLLCPFISKGVFFFMLVLLCLLHRFILECFIVMSKQVLNSC